MKNFEKYKTTKERMIAFDEFRKTHEEWFNAPSCAFKWLDLEVEEEKPMPCPFCGSECSIDTSNDLTYIECNKLECSYFSGNYKTKAEAIATHNRVCKAVAAYKGNN